MTFWRTTVLAVLIAAALTGAKTNAEEAPGRVAIVTGNQAPELERYAAKELGRYLHKLFGIQAQPTTSLPKQSDAIFLVGSPVTNPAIRQVAGKTFPRLTEQGIVLKRAKVKNEPALIVGGGSAPATLWAVYELVERWGVRYLLHGDVLPPKAKSFRLPDHDVVMEPKLTIRQWRVLNEHAGGPTSWGMADYGTVIDQLAKLKYNRVLISTWPSQPFIDLEVRDIKRRTGAMYFGQRYPLSDDMIGRHLLGNRAEYMNPDLPVGGSYEELSAALQKLLHNMMNYAHQRGMEVVLTAYPIEYPSDFAPLLGGGQKVVTWGADLTTMPKTDTSVDDPVLEELATAVMRATVNTYPQADYILIYMPEFRQWAGMYEQAWQDLDKRYGFEKVLHLEDALAAGEQRSLKYYKNKTRAVDEVKGDIVMLYFLDRLFRNRKILQGTANPNVKLIYSGVVEELFPVLRQLMEPGWETLNGLDYTPATAVPRLDEALSALDIKGVPATMIYTLQDDNTGYVPLLETKPLDKMTQALLKYGWAGFSTRYWLIGGHDSVTTYLSKVAWNPNLTSAEVRRDQVRAVLGSEAVEDMVKVFDEVGAATEIFEWKSLSFAFPVPETVTQWWSVWEPRPYYYEIREHYQRALDAARRAQVKARGNHRSYVDYWVGHLEYGVAYMDMVEQVRRAGKAEAGGQKDVAVQHGEKALALLRQALESFARVARDQSDFGALAVMNHYGYFKLRDKVEEAKKKQ